MFDYDMTIGQETTKMSAGVLSGSAFCFMNELSIWHVIEKIHWIRVHEVYFAYIIVKHYELLCQLI